MEKMILYFDNLITDIPLFPGIYPELDEIREKDTSYKFKSRLEVTKYTLASYAELPWSDVIIKYELQPFDEKQKEDFEKFVKKLFPKAHIFYGRSDNQEKFQEMGNLINKFKGNWIFYAANNDHPFVAPNRKLLGKCLEKAKELGKKYPYISIDFSHYPEPLNVGKPGNAFHDIGYPTSKKIEETEDFSIMHFPRGFFASRQIVNKNLMNYWIYHKNMGNKTLRRICEDIYKSLSFYERKGQIIICPKKEICAHYDGYGQTKGTGYHLSSDLIPPLFIPDGFFENKVKIAFGYNEYRDGWVNINPLKKKYSFRNKKNGTDMMIDLEDIPLFWKKRIQVVDINPKVDMGKLKKARDKKFQIIENVYLTRNYLNFSYYELYVLYYRIKPIIKKIKTNPKKYLNKLNFLNRVS